MHVGNLENKFRAMREIRSEVYIPSENKRIRGDHGMLSCLLHNLYEHYEQPPSAGNSRYGYDIS